MAKDQRLWLPAARALPSDLARLARQIPIVRIDRWMDLRELAHARLVTVPRISWTALYVRAYGLLAEEFPCLRYTYFAWPLAHLYEHAQSVAMVAVQRNDHPAPRLCWGRITRPGQRTLIDIQDHLDRFQREPVERVFRKQIWFSRLPGFLRRVIWWSTMNVSGRYRARQLGTFGVSSLAGQGVFNRDHPTLLTSGLTFGPTDPHGQALVTLLFDHRVLDGMEGSRVLRRLEHHLQQTVVAELHYLRRPAAA